MGKNNKIPLRKRSLFWSISSILLLIIFLILDFISILPNYPQQPIQENLSSDWGSIILFTILSILLGRKIWKVLKERTLYAIKIPLQKTSGFWTIAYVFGFSMASFVTFLLFSVIFDDKHLSDGDYAGIFFILTSFVFAIFLGREILREWKKRRFYAVFDINGIHIHSKNRNTDIKWEQISRVGYQAVVQANSDLPEGWGYFALSLKSQKEELLKDIDSSLIDNKSILTFEQIKNYFGKDKLDIYIMMSFQSSKKKMMI